MSFSAQRFSTIHTRRAAARARADLAYGLTAPTAPVPAPLVMVDNVSTLFALPRAYAYASGYHYERPPVRVTIKRFIARRFRYAHVSFTYDI